MRAQIQLEQKEIEPALATLRQMVETDPQDGESWQLLAQGLAANERADEALALIEANLASDAALDQLYALLAQLYAAAGRRQEAEEALRTFVERSDSPAAAQSLIQYLANRGEIAAVQETVLDAISRFPNEPGLYVTLSETQLELGDLEAAEHAAESYGDLPNALEANREYLRARLELANGDAAAAGERLRALAPKLDLAHVQFWLGSALEQQGELEGAARRYQLAVQRDPRWPPPLMALTGLAVRRGDWRAAASLSRRSLRLDPESKEAWQTLSRGLIELQEGEAAEQATAHALTVHPDEPIFRVYQAHALRLLGRPDEALAQIELAEEAYADDPAAAAEAAIALGMIGRTEQGIALTDRELARHPDEAGLHAARASLLYVVGRAAEGDRATERALELDPVRCRFRTATGRLAGAIADCSRYETMRPSDARAPFMLGVAYSGTGEHEKAIVAYRRAASLDPADHQSRNNLAWLLAEEGDLDAALEVGQEAYRLANEDPYVADTLADLYLRKGLVERAIALLERAHAAAPQMPDASLHLAQAYQRAGRPGDARPLLQALDADLPADHRLRPALEEELIGLP
jgi:tetratricopeptide (TPR) repeat protein